MPKNKGWYAEMMERRPLVARLHLRHQKPGFIHQEALKAGHNCDYATIRRDIAALEAEWRKELIADPVSLKAREWAEIEEAEAECWLQYEGSHARDWLAELRAWKGRKARLLGLDYRPYKQSPGSSEDKALDTQETNGFDVSKLSDDELETICFIFESHMDS